MKPLEGLLVVEFGIYLAAPSAGLKLADLGARVIKVEPPARGEPCRHLAIKHLFIGSDSLLFHTINRNKQSYAANLKDPADLEKVKRLVARADVLTHNFRPGTMEKFGLGWDEVRELNPRLVYAEISGYGTQGPWRNKPGQDLLAQSVSGLTWLSGDAGAPPTPMGIAVADMLCGAHLLQGILAALVRRAKTGRGAHVEVSLLESVLDFQFEVLTTHLNDGGRRPQRARRGNAHAYLAAPYGVYATADGYLALAMGSLDRLAKLIGCEELERFPGAGDGFAHRDEIMEILARHLAQRTTAEWLALLEPADVWCAEVLDYPHLSAHEGFRALEMDQELELSDGTKIRTLRCPIRIDGERLSSRRPAPAVGQHNQIIERELLDA